MLSAAAAAGGSGGVGGAVDVDGGGVSAAVYLDPDQTT
jgi:hypothetical protein